MKFGIILPNKAGHIKKHVKKSVSFCLENMQKIQSMRNGSIEVSNVLALIRHTFNEFGDLQVNMFSYFMFMVLIGHRYLLEYNPLFII